MKLTKYPTSKCGLYIYIQVTYHTYIVQYEKGKIKVDNLFSEMLKHTPTYSNILQCVNALALAYAYDDSGAETINLKLVMNVVMQQEL